MSNMICLYQNYFNTTTIGTVTNGTTSVQYMFDRKRNTQFKSSGDNSDLTTTSIHLVFPVTKTINKIALQNINLKSFFIYYDTTTSKISLTSAVGGTSTANWTGNSLTSMYLQFATIQSTKIGIVATTTFAANEEKSIGEFWVSQKYLEFENNPSVENYRTTKDRKEFVHEMAGGGHAQYVIDDYYKADIRLHYEAQSMTTLFRNLYDEQTPFTFAPFPTSTGWDERIYEVIWTGNFDFDQPKLNDTAQNFFTGRLSLKERSR